MVDIYSLLDHARDNRLQTGRPLVTLSYAQSLDGSLAGKRGQPMELSGPESMLLTHKLRSAHSAILVGIGTVLADDPRLTTRLAGENNPQPVILDTHLRIPLQAKLFSGPVRPWIAASLPIDFNRQQEIEALGGRILPLPTDQVGHISLPILLDILGHSGLDSLMVEGGATVIRSFLEQNLADQAVITIAPVFVGGLNVLGGLAPLPDRPRLADVRCERLGDDLVIWGRLH